LCDDPSTMFEHFDERARMCVVLAQEELRRLGHAEMASIHLLLGVARVDAELLGIEVEALRAAIVALTGIGTPSDDPVPMSADGKAALEGANTQALRLGHTTIDPAHLLLALIEVGGGARALREAGAIPSEVRERANAAAGTQRPTDRQADDGPPAQHVEDLRAGRPVAVRLGADAYPIGDLGHPQVDAQLLELILVNDTIVAQLLRDHGIDERLLRETFGPADAGD
jgi:ATP-dependent Clp protease ATP-binding subunit ClpA